MILYEGFKQLKIAENNMLDQCFYQSLADSLATFGLDVELFTHLAWLTQAIVENYWGFVCLVFSVS